MTRDGIGTVVVIAMAACLLYVLLGSAVGKLLRHRSRTQSRPVRPPDDR